MLRRIARAVLIVASGLALAFPARAAEKEPSALVPSNASLYGEANVGRVRSGGPDALAVAEWLRHAVAVRTAIEVAKENPKGLSPSLKEGRAWIKGLLPVSATIGSRVGWAVWVPPSGRHGRVEWLVVAGVKDGAAFDRACLQAVHDLYAGHVKENAGEKAPGVHLSLTIDDTVLASGDGWVAFGTAKQVSEAARRAAGEVHDSLQSQETYRRALVGLPSGAAVIQYFSGALLRQALEPLVALRPNTVSPPGDGIAWAIDLRVEPRDGRRMLVANWMMDLDASIYVLDAPVAAWGLPAVVADKNDAVREVGCRDNLTILAKAMQQYRTEHEGRFPRADRWVAELTRYVPSPKAFKCPRDASAAKASYGMNFALSGDLLPEGADPMRVAVLYETIAPGENPAGGEADVYCSRHNHGALYVLADGTVVQGQTSLDWLSPKKPTQQ